MQQENKSDDNTPLLNKDANEESSVADDSTSQNGHAHLEEPISNTKSSKAAKKPAKKVNIIQLFSFADKLDKILLVIGCCTTVIYAFIIPWLAYLMGSLAGLLVQGVFDICLVVDTYQCPFGIDLQVDNFMRYNHLCKTNATVKSVSVEDTSHFLAHVHNLIIQTFVFATVQLLVTTLNYIIFVVTSERQANRMREALFRLMLNKNLTYFDQNLSTEWYVKLSSNIDRIAMGISDQFSSFFSAILIPIIGMIICLCIYWPLALMLFVWMVIGVITISWLSKVMNRVTIQEMRAYTRAGSVAQQALGALRTVLANNAIQYILQQYSNCLDYVGQYTVKKGTIFGLTQSLLKLMQYFMIVIGLLSLSLIFYELSSDRRPSSQDILTIFLVAVICPIFMIQAGAHSTYVSEAQGAAVDVFDMLNEDQSTNDYNKGADKELLREALFERIELDHVTFAYPARPQVNALDDVSFSVERGNTVALVGHSGSGKSSCVQLLTRLYELNDGHIRLDGVPLTDYDREWLRQNIAIVSQESNLFSTTIYNNIQYGNMTATHDDIIEAAKQANAHTFIMTLPNKYETMIGERGVNLSGGERQRIVLARALVRKAPILLLDEPTSALDRRSEKLLQQALDRACQSRLTIIIAHRLSTIRECSCIYVMDHGKIVEFGNHETLMARQGFYYNLLQTQQQENIDENDSDILNNDNINQENDRLVTDISDVISSNNNDINTKKSKSKHPIFVLMKMARPEFIYILVGSLICLVYGVFDVLYCILNGFLAGMLQKCDLEEQKNDAKVICFFCLIIGVLAFSINLFVHTNFAVVSATFVKRLRVRALAAFFRQEVAWHDQEVNNSAALCVRLSTDCDDVKRLVYIRIVFVLQTISTLIFGSVFGFLVSWQLMLVIWVMIIILALTIAIMIQLSQEHVSNHSLYMQKAAMLSVECISSIRTVHQLGKNEDFVRDYTALINQANMKKTTLFGIAICVGVRRSIARFTVPVLYVLAMHLVYINKMKLVDTKGVFSYVIYTNFITSLVEMTVSEISRSGKASRNLVELFQRRSMINSETSAGLKPNSFDGHINYDKVSFSYPTRPHIKVLNQLSLEINQGQRIALIGPSGCGKSSIIQLVARFYDVNQGRLLLDDIDIRSLNVHWWRSQLALVNQDPILFDGTIRDNIVFGCQYRSESLPNLEQVIEAAKQAKIHDFISTLPQGYDTNVGVSGTQVSGGQKQRIVIARCLLRQAKLLLLDEATSAMDTLNEQLIQQALEQAHLTQNCTTIIVAHRLSTIRHCDVICVLNNCGQIVESGSHETLLALRGVYYRMLRASSA